MLAKRIIPCLDVKNGQVVKGVRFRQHQIVGDISELAAQYSEQGADELVFYDITASSDSRSVDTQWVSRVASLINIPFCVAGGIRSLQQAQKILYAGADKISINSPAIENPDLINQLVREFGQQCVVIGIDSFFQDGGYTVYQYTGDIKKTIKAGLRTEDWVRQVQDRGAGEIVLNCMNQDGVRQGYDIEQLSLIRSITNIPLIGSGGAGELVHFSEVFKKAQVDGALAASVFHSNGIRFNQLKMYLNQQQVKVRL